MACKSQPYREVEVAFSAAPQTPLAKSASQGYKPLDFSRLQSCIYLSTEIFCLYDNDSIDLSY
jgi:hypothetical protein